MQKDFGKKAKVNKIIRYLTEGGFFVKWHHENIRRRKYEIPFTVSPLIEMERLWMSFALAGIGWSMATSAFCLELIVHKMVNKRNDRRWIWINLEHMCDGHRHRFLNLTNKSN